MLVGGKAPSRGLATNHNAWCCRRRQRYVYCSSQKGTGKNGRASTVPRKRGTVSDKSCSRCRVNWRSGVDEKFWDESGVAPEWCWLRPEDRGFVELLDGVSGGVSDDDDDSVLGFIKFLAGRHGSPPFGVGQRDCSTGGE